jgi:hypothetical protein
MKRLGWHFVSVVSIDGHALFNQVKLYRQRG